MAEQVKLLGLNKSPFSCRVEIALRLKGVQYEFIEEDLANKSDDLLKYNPIHKKVPVLLHNGKVILESVIIVEYIDETFKGPSILPDDPFDKAVARFWVNFIDDKFTTAIRNTFFGKGEEQEKAIIEIHELLKTLEDQLKGKKYFGGDTIGLVDIVANLISDSLPVFEEVSGIELVTKEKFCQEQQKQNEQEQKLKRKWQKTRTESSSFAENFSTCLFRSILHSYIQVSTSMQLAITTWPLV